MKFSRYIISGFVMLATLALASLFTTAPAAAYDIPTEAAGLYPDKQASIVFMINAVDFTVNKDKSAAVYAIKEREKQNWRLVRRFQFSKLNGLSIRSRRSPNVKGAPILI